MPAPPLQGAGGHAAPGSPAAAPSQVHGGCGTLACPTAAFGSSSAGTATVPGGPMSPAFSSAAAASAAAAAGEPSGVPLAFPGPATSPSRERGHPPGRGGPSSPGRAPTTPPPSPRPRFYDERGGAATQPPQWQTGRHRPVCKFHLSNECSADKCAFDHVQPAALATTCSGFGPPRRRC
eukprot:TRINITY_DN7591_c0_g1_i1.p1 TRINITY_DN7591_c0_g1~~TRINITY_DN7591_c0_g1_i1.p1  ORF type:complete len:208 (+),score=28.42 TRINITY_DN7591_c0_g1_i1:89-625(+)